ncbi:DNA polymerase III subunit psi [Oceanisphaera sp. IT1-181]|uniref:DNA polymerase III subunit psi n=1 Tax=Oceanisphaera sp. IT1-181 TaxID=3081199 RepID=UPI0029CA1C36|nr:DNA polymerase III subunit psi [Oceanisphaera sp. IT1-181]
MTPTQSQLWQFLGLAHWHCAHPERLPLAPMPKVAPAEVLIIFGSAANLSSRFIADLLVALSLDKSQLQSMSQADWLAANKPTARVLLGLNVTGELDAFHWQANLPLAVSPVLTSSQKRALWSCLCRCYLEH